MKTLLAFALCTVTSVGHAADIKLRDGQYSNKYISYNSPEKPKPRFELRKRNTRVMLRDTKRNVVYNLDLASAGEQNLPAHFIELIANNPRNGSIGSLIKGVTITDIRQGEDADKILLNANISIAMESAFGSIQSKVQLGLKVTKNEQSIQSYDNSNNSFRTIIADKVSLIGAASGTKLLSFTSSLGSQADQIIGLLLDLGLRLTDPAMLVDLSLEEYVR